MIVKVGDAGDDSDGGDSVTFREWGDGDISGHNYDNDSGSGGCDEGGSDDSGSGDGMWWMLLKGVDSAEEDDDRRLSLL